MDGLAQLLPQLKHLRLSGLLESLELRNRQAVEEQLSYLEFLERLLQDEVERRAHKQLRLRLRRSGLRSDKASVLPQRARPHHHRREFPRSLAAACSAF